jgi:prepilin-type N-terminal cleavage/methylation domain-containing protein
MKKGFTLVEIMVVVIIMGVLAAVGVPKLFGLIAKARASEVPVAAGTYISLQNAYLGENNGIGSWKNIGYGAPGNGRTDYFEYSGCINGTIPFASMEPDMPGWQASNLSGLNSCKTGGAWAVIIDPAGEREIEYRQIITSAECAMLTSTWGEVGETVEGMCETTGELHVAGTENKTPGKPETPTTPDETPADPVENPTPQQDQTTTENPEPKQGSCDALEKSMTGKGADKGNKYGWVCVSACGMFAPPGKARNAGFDTGTLQKKKDTGGDCKKVEPEGTTTDNNPPIEEDPNEIETDPQPEGTVTSDGVVKGSGSTSGYKGFGDYKDSNSDGVICLKSTTTGKGNKAVTTCNEWIEKGYAGKDGNASNEFNQNSDACIKGTQDNNIGECLAWVHQSECLTMKSTKNGKGVFCTAW